MIAALRPSDETPHSTRRELLKQGAATLAAATLAQPVIGADSPDQGFIDAHSHIWTPDLERYPLAAGFEKPDMQPASFTPEELLAQARPCGVSRVVLIQMSYYRFDNRYMLDAIRVQPETFRGVAVIDHHAAGAAETMRTLKGRGVRGFRINPGKEPVEAWLFSDAMSAMWTVGASERLAMCGLINPEALPAFDRMCAKYPETPVVIDHFARIGIDGQIRTVDVDNLCRLARHPRVHVKVSAFYALGEKKAPYTDLGPMIRRLLSAYGRERLMWATDCPYQVEKGHTYRDSIELIQRRLDFLSPDDKSWLLGKTAEQVFFS